MPEGLRTLYRYSEDDRLAQLRRFGDACAALADLLEQHAEPTLAGTYRNLALTAGRLRAPFDQRELLELATSLPTLSGRLHPRYIEEHGPPEPWHRGLGALDREAAGVAIELRAFATYDDPHRSDIP